jgi:hypothetical protein
MGRTSGSRSGDRLVVLYSKMLGHAYPWRSAQARCWQCELAWCRAWGYWARAAFARVGLVQLRQTGGEYARGVRAERGFRTL